MKFGEKLHMARTDAKMTQAELARRLGVAKRTVEGYEACQFYPRKRKIYDQLAEIFNVEKNWLLTEDDMDAPETARRDMDQAIAGIQALYSGGRLSEEDKDALAKALMDAYWIAKGRQQKK